jgi:uncharacterized membrane protein YGL010W
MDNLRKSALVILSPLFIFLLFATAFDIGFTRTATHPATVKKLISESGLYDSLVPGVIEQNKTISTSIGDIPTSDPQIQKAAQAAITPQTVKTQTETAIDSIYQWLDGKSSQPDFNINFNSSKGTFADNVASAVQGKLDGLPACTRAQSLAIAQTGGFNATNASCLPQGVTAASAAEEIKNSINNSDFFSKAKIDAGDIKGSGNTAFFQTDKAKKIPKQYQRAKKTPWILSILTILTGAGIVLLSRTWQKGLRHIGINLLIIGLLMLAFTYVLNRVVIGNVSKLNIDISPAVAHDVRNLVIDLSRQVNRNYLFFGILYAASGAASITAVEVLRRKQAPVLVVATEGQKPKTKPD